jgi:hypothetical protein
MKTPLTDVIEQLKKTRNQDRKNSAETFAAAANLIGITEKVVETTSTLIEEFTPLAELEAVANHEMQFRTLLEARLKSLRSEADGLLLAANSNEEIDRLTRLESLIDLINSRMKSLSLPIIEPPIKEVETLVKEVETLDKLPVAKLKEMAKQRRLTGYSRLNKTQLIDLLSKVVDNVHPR